MGDTSKPRVTNGKIVGQIDATKVPRYSGLTTFAQLPELHEVSDVEVAIVGIPFDSGVSYRPGAGLVLAMSAKRHVCSARTTLPVMFHHSRNNKLQMLVTFRQILLTLKMQLPVFIRVTTNLQSAQNAL